MRNYGTGLSKASHYKPLEGDDAARMRDVRRRAAKAKPARLPSVDLGPAKQPQSAERKLEYPTAPVEPRRDRNW